MSGQTLLAAGQKKPKIVTRGVVFRDENAGARQSSLFHSICVLPTGRWLCGWSVADTKKATRRECLFRYSDDEGKTWSAPSSPFRPPRIENHPGSFLQAKLTSLGGRRVLAALNWVDQTDPGLPFFNERTEGLLDTRIFLTVSEDEGVTWSTPRVMDTTPFHVPTSLTGPILILPTGEWACQFELHKHYHEPAEWRHSSVLMFSRDEGRTWPAHAIVSADPANRIFYWDQRPGVLPEGRLLDVFWTYDRVAATYRNIHASESFDDGHTWSPLWDTGVPGQPAPPVALPDGRLALVYVDRAGSPAIKLRLSGDQGRTRPGETELALYETKLSSQTWPKRQDNSTQDAWAEMVNFSVGLPTTAALPDGDVLVVYYAGEHPDRTGVEWLRLAVERRRVSPLGRVSRERIDLPTEPVVLPGELATRASG